VEPHFGSSCGERLSDRQRIASQSGAGWQPAADCQSEALAKTRTALAGEALSSVVSRKLKLPARKDTPDYRILRPIRGRGFPKKEFATYAVETEPGIQAIVYRLSDDPLFSRPPRGQQRAILYVSHRSADAELRDEPLIGEAMRDEPDSAFFVCDTRGIGESQSNTGSDYFYAIHSIMLDRPYAGQRTHDVLAVLDWLKAQGHSEVHLIGKGWGAIPAGFAALLAPGVVQVTLKNAPASYSAIAESETYRWPLALLIPGVLEQFDLPDCYRALESKRIRQIDPWGPNAG
jgi:hypothetical protein